jgi:hypothetical protein
LTRALPNLAALYVSTARNREEENRMRNFDFVNVELGQAGTKMELGQAIADYCSTGNRKDVIDGILSNINRLELIFAHPCNLFCCVVDETDNIWIRGGNPDINAGIIMIHANNEGDLLCWEKVCDQSVISTMQLLFDKALRLYRYEIYRGLSECFIRETQIPQKTDNRPIAIKMLSKIAENIFDRIHPYKYNLRLCQFLWRIVCKLREQPKTLKEKIECE